MKRVLIVGMLDSVHLARWLKQFSSSDVQITLFPSRRYKKLHPDIEFLLKSGEVRLFKKLFIRGLRLEGYLDFLSFEIPNVTLRLKRRAQSLQKCLDEFQPDIVHLIELQHAGYLYLETQVEEKNFDLIVTNYGSDISYFQNYHDDKDKISKVLSLADYYSAECRRDYKLATKFGFTGIQLPLIPNAGGFALSDIENSILELDKRNLIFVKGYGGKFGLGHLALDAISRVLDKFSAIEAVVVSLTNDLEKNARALETKFGPRITIHRMKDGLSHNEILAILKKSIIYLGASKSDGISTTFLEALVAGAIPVQTNTSCASEWLEKGFIAKIVSPSEEAIFSSVCEILERKIEYTAISKANMALAKTYLDDKEIASIAKTFYQIDNLLC
jgi:glycosyltransferase involved in cell wall biosynthesis